LIESAGGHEVAVQHVGVVDPQQPLVVGTGQHGAIAAEESGGPQQSGGTTRGAAERAPGQTIDPRPWRVCPATALDASRASAATPMSSNGRTPRLDRHSLFTGVVYPDFRC
jgi:hypothetical protein